MEQASVERKWIIYMYTFPNGKRYIGKTFRSLKERQESAEWIGYRNCPVLWRAICKYKIENIKQDILFESYMTDEYSSRLEMICISLFKTNCNKYSNPSYGYNETDGGEGTIGHKHNDEAKAKMRKPRPQCSGINHHNSKEVYCIELDKIFVNAREAERETGVSFGSISNCCIGKSKSTRGGNTKFDVLHWEFRIGAIEKPEKLIATSRGTKAVYCIELDATFSSVRCASEQGYGTVDKIRGSCKQSKLLSKHVNPNVLHWVYEDDKTDEIVNNILNKIQQSKQN